MRALGALAKIWLRFFYRLAKSLVVAGSLNGALDFVGSVAGRPENAPEEAAGGTQRAAGHAGHAGLEFSHKAIAAAITEEFKLIALIGGVIGMVSGELNQRHSRSLGPFFDCACRAF